MKTYYPWDSRKISKEDREPLKEFWDSLDEKQRKLVGVLMDHSQEVHSEDWKYRDWK